MFCLKSLLRWMVYKVHRHLKFILFGHWYSPKSIHVSFDANRKIKFISLGTAHPQKTKARSSHLSFEVNIRSKRRTLKLLPVRLHFSYTQTIQIGLVLTYFINTLKVLQGNVYDRKWILSNKQHGYYILGISTNDDTLS